MDCFFVSLLFGHLVGDYVLQTNWMAMNKSKNSLKCSVHCAIYTTAILLFTKGWQDWNWIALVFVSHFVIDRFGIADLWLKFIKSRSLSSFLDNGRENIPESDDIKFENYWVLRGGFTALVYAVTDNTLHLLIMYYSKSII